MSWVPIVGLILQYILLLLKALRNPDTVHMVLKTADGELHTLRCNVHQVSLGKYKITSTFNATGQAIIDGLIVIDGKQFARLKLTNKLYQTVPGPMEMGDVF